MSDEEEQQPKRARTAGAGAAAASLSSSLLVGGVRVASVGLGCLALSVGYPSAPPSTAVVDGVLRSAAAAASPHALFVDTADVYCHPHTSLHQSERAVAAVQSSLGSAAASLVVSTKSGMKRVSDDSSGWRPGANNAASVRAGILAARANLSPGQPLFLYSLHHSDAFAPPGCIESALQEAAACVAEGLVRNIGLCNATVPLLDRALRCGAVPLAAVQNEWSLFTREADKELPPSAAASSKKGVLLWCARHNVPFVAYSSLGGLKTRRGERQALGEKVPAIAALAKAKGVSQQAITLAAMLHRGGQLGARVLLLVGARSEAHIVDSIGAAAVRLTDAETAQVMGAL